MRAYKEGWFAGSCCNTGARPIIVQPAAAAAAAAAADAAADAADAATTSTTCSSSKSVRSPPPRTHKHAHQTNHNDDDDDATTTSTSTSTTKSASWHATHYSHTPLNHELEQSETHCLMSARSTKARSIASDTLEVVSTKTLSRSRRLSI